MQRSFFAFLSCLRCMHSCVSFRQSMYLSRELFSSMSTSFSLFNSTIRALHSWMRDNRTSDSPMSYQHVYATMPLTSSILTRSSYMAIQRDDKWSEVLLMLSTAFKLIENVLWELNIVSCRLMICSSTTDSYSSVAVCYSFKSRNCAGSTVSDGIGEN